MTELWMRAFVTLFLLFAATCFAGFATIERERVSRWALRLAIVLALSIVGMLIYAAWAVPFPVKS